MSDTQENAPKGNPNGSGEPNGDRRRRSRGGRNRNRNRNNKPKEEGQENAKPVEAQSSEEAKPPKEGEPRNRNSRNRNQRNKNNRRPEGKEVKAAPVSEELQEQLEAQNELYNLEFEKDGPAIWEETIHVKPVIGITCGDLNGIGMEIIMKTLENTELTDLCTPVVFGSSKLASYHRNAVGMNEFNFRICDSLDDIHEGKNNLINVWDDTVELSLGTPTDVSGLYALKSIDAAVQAAKAEKIHAIVTAPINKHNISSSVEGFSGHTNYLAEQWGDQVLMILTSDRLKVASVTGHVPIAKVSEGISKESVSTAIELLATSLKRDFGKVRPTIAVLGLNPHAGELGTMGSEEIDHISPAIAEKNGKQMIVKGPFAADGFFGQGYETKFDAVLGMYHDQVLIPFKSLSMGEGTNFTAGLSTVRTSPDHGTAMHLAGKGVASSDSFRSALFSAIEIVQMRMQVDEMTKNPLKKQKEKN